MRKSLLVMVWSVMVAFFLLVDARERDPFYLPTKSKTKSVKNLEIILAGLVGGAGRAGALVHIGDRTEIVYENDEIDGYKIEKIANDHVVIKKKRQSIVLSLRE